MNDPTTTTGAPPAPRRRRRRTAALGLLGVSAVAVIAGAGLNSTEAGAAVAAAPTGIDRVVSLSGTIDSTCGAGVSGPVYTTIQAAVDAATVGQQIYVCAGTYNENVSITRNNIDLIGPNWNDPEGTSDAAVIVASDNSQPVVNFGTASLSDNGVRGFTLQGGTFGVRAQGTSGAAWDDPNTEGIRNNVITGSTVAGIQTNGLDSGLIAGNRISPAAGANGIDTINAVGALNIQSNTIELTGTSGTGIIAQMANGGEQGGQTIGGATAALGNTVTGGDTGVLLKGTPTLAYADNNTVSNNTLTGQASNGVRTEGVVYIITISQNKISDSGASGILIAGPPVNTGNDTESVTITGNTIDNAGRDGVEVTGYALNIRVGATGAGNGNTITEPARHGVNFDGYVITPGAQLTRNLSIDLAYANFNTITGAGGDGVRMVNVDLADVWNNTISDSGGNGVFTSVVDWSDVRNNTITGSGEDGVRYNDTADGWITSNTIENNTGDGIEMTGGTSSIVVNLNQVHLNATGVRVTGGAYTGTPNLITDNDVSQNLGYGCEDQTPGSIANPPAVGTQGNDWTTTNVGAALQSPEGICGAVMTLTDSVLDGEQANPYSSPSATPSGAPAGSTYTYTSAGLPAGLTMNPATGEITGTPTTPVAERQMHVWVRTNGGLWGQVNPKITIYPTLTANDATKAGVEGTPISPFNPTVTGGNTATTKTFSVAPGSADDLPPGLSLNPTTGQVTGTPTAAGTYVVTFKVTDNSPNMEDTANLPAGSDELPANADTYVVTFNIDEASEELAASGSFDPGRENEAYSSDAPTATGGTGPYTWSTTSTLPDGLTLDPATGIISGSPAIGSEGTYPVTLTATDDTGATASFTSDLVILPEADGIPLADPLVGGLTVLLLAGGGVVLLGRRRNTAGLS